MNVQFHPEAERELEEAESYYAEIRSDLAVGFIAEVGRAILRIQEEPDRYAVVEQNIRHVRLRRFPHAVYFRAESDLIIILAIHHPRRHPERWRER